MYERKIEFSDAMARSSSIAPTSDAATGSTDCNVVVMAMELGTTAAVKLSKSLYPNCKSIKSICS